ncbi:MAG: putative ABC transporter permease [Butyrivibrio sp.]|nr:putative ABC transporter permease [Butyrivibrio sp.]
MFNYLPLQWLFLFYFYSFFGWCFESTYVTIMEKHPVNRGFMRGPFLPLYGSGGIMMLVVSKPFYDNVLLVFIAGCIGATALELITGIVMESLFKVRYWDYSHKKFHFHGYICLESTIVWGVCTVIFTHYLQIPIERIITAIPYNIVTITTVVVTVLVSADFVLAFKTAIDLRDVLIYMDRAKFEMQRIQKRLDAIIAFKGEDVREGIGSRVDALSEGIGSRVGSISEGIGNRVESISYSLEKSFNIIREKMNLDPGAFVGNAREEVMEMYAKYRVMMARFTPKPVKSFLEWYRDKTIEGNPTMSSSEHESSLEEVKENNRRKRLN